MADLNGIVFEHEKFLDGYDGLFGLGMRYLQSNKMYDVLKANKLEEQFSLFMNSDGKSFFYGGDFDPTVIKKDAEASTVASFDEDQWIFHLKSMRYFDDIMPLEDNQQVKLSLRSEKIEIPQKSFDSFIKKLEKYYSEPVKNEKDQPGNYYFEGEKCPKSSKYHLSLYFDASEKQNDVVTLSRNALYSNIQGSCYLNVVPSD